MSNTAHTREVADLRNAGLNPILSSKGAGAPTGAGAMAQTPDCPLPPSNKEEIIIKVGEGRKMNQN
jgi:hypothetical protein